MGSYLSKK